MNRTSVLVGGLFLVFIVFVVRTVLAPARTVWAVNGLDVPLEVSVAGQTMRVPAHGHSSVEAKGRVLEFVANTIEGREVDRVMVNPRAKYKLAFNPLGAARLIISSEVFVPPHRQFVPAITDRIPQDEAIEAARIVERQNIDFFLETVPVTMQFETNDPGNRLLRRLSIDGDWRSTVRFLENSNRKRDALTLAQAVAATQPKRADAQEVVKALMPRPSQPPPEMEAPAESTPAQLATWHTVSKDGRARVEQTSIDGMKCTTRCEVSGVVTWSRNGCISKDGEFRFTSGDCDCLIVLRVVGEGSWHYSPVLLIYRRGRLEKSLAAGDFISDENAITPAGDVFDWLESGGQVISEPSGIEFETRDGRKQHILFAAEVK